jgi:hypothetical protein
MQLVRNSCSSTPGLHCLCVRIQLRGGCVTPRARRATAGVLDTAAHGARRRDGHADVFWSGRAGEVADQPPRHCASGDHDHEDGDGDPRGAPLTARERVRRRGLASAGRRCSFFRLTRFDDKSGDRETSARKTVASRVPDVSHCTARLASAVKRISRQSSHRRTQAQVGRATGCAPPPWSAGHWTSSPTGDTRDRNSERRAPHAHRRMAEPARPTRWGRRPRRAGMAAG